MQKLSWLISLGLTLTGFLIIEHLFTVNPTSFSGNGNFGLMAIPFIIPFLLLSLFTTYKYIQHLTVNAKSTTSIWISIGTSIVFAGILLYFCFDYKENLYEALGEPALGPDSKIYGFEFINQYTNSILFNPFTFLFVHSISGVIGAVYGFIKKLANKK